MSKAKKTLSLKTSIVEELPCTGLLSHITTLSGYLPRLGRYLGIPNPEGDREMFRCFLCFTPPPLSAILRHRWLHYQIFPQDTLPSFPLVSYTTLL